MKDTNQEQQAAFLEDMNSLKEYARVNGGFITKEDIRNYFKDMKLDDNQMSMIYGYLMAGNIKIRGESPVGNQFYAMMSESQKKAEAEEEQLQQEETVKGAAESTAKEEEKNFSQNADPARAGASYSDSMTMPEKSKVSQAGQSKEQKQAPDLEKLAQENQYVAMYLEELGNMEQMSDTSRALLFMNIVEDKDIESLNLLTESFLPSIVTWVDAYRGKGVAVNDLIQEANLAMMGYMKEQRFLHNDKLVNMIRNGGSPELMEVLKQVTEEVREEVDGTLAMLIDEQKQEGDIASKVLNKVNLVNDWASRLRTELGRKPTPAEIAEKMGVPLSVVTEAIQLSAEAIPDIQLS